MKAQLGTHTRKSPLFFPADLRPISLSSDFADEEPITQKRLSLSLDTT